jgi:hypothetical protein
MNFSFTGTFGADDDVQLFSFTTDGSSTVTLRSYSYAGGTQADGNVMSHGGFDPGMTLFDATGLRIGKDDDNDDDGEVVTRIRTPVNAGTPEFRRCCPPVHTSLRSISSTIPQADSISHTGSIEKVNRSSRMI